MSSTKKLLTAIGLAKAPKTTLFLKKPLKMAAAVTAWAAAKRAAPRFTTKTAAAVGTAVAAAVVAPLAVKAYRESASN